MDKDFDNLLKLLNTKIKDITQYKAEYKKLKNEIAELKRKGIINAKASFRKGKYKYLYLVYPMVKGERKKDYIGSDQLKIKEALQKIENYKNVVNKTERQKEIMAEIRAFHSRVEPKYW